MLSVLIHGDAAFAGQGVVAETLNLSELPGYDVGGTVHIVVNNQVGFTTPAGFARSTVYATDIAKAVQAPIFHVNGDDPEASVRVIRLAYEFRNAFKKDVVVDMVCYRRYGHNEGDEPAFTQPRMYEVIGNRRSVRKLYTELLVNRGDLTLEDAEKAFEDFRARLEEAFGETHTSERPSSTLARPTPEPEASHVETGVPRDRLERIITALTTFPADFEPHPKLARILANRRKEFDTDQIDWALAEELAFGSLLLEGAPVRVAGQDTRRGTFSQRHAVVVDHRTEQEYVPLAHLGEDAAPFMIYDSVLSEFAALGFEYGYSVADHDALVAWEAQFGDFANGGQVIIDQFLVAAEDKWGQRSGLVLLLPHGFEGQGPEHSSARLERFLVLAAQDNMRVGVSDDVRAVLPRAPPSGAGPEPQAVDRDDPEAVSAHAGHRVAGRRVHARRLPTGARRSQPARVTAAHRVHDRQVRSRAPRAPRRAARADRDRAPRAVVSVAGR